MPSNEVTFETDVAAIRQFGFRVQGAIDSAMRRGIEAAALDMAGRIARSVQTGPRSGYVYWWRAAKPGEAPDSFISIRRNFSDPLIGIAKGSARVFPVKWRAIPHQSSAIGEYPKTDTGELTSHFKVRAGSFLSIGRGQISARYQEVQAEGGRTAVGRVRNAYSAFIVNDAPHARHLEFKPPGMGGRPFMSRGARENYKRTRRIVQLMLNRSLKTLNEGR